ncbi:glycosyltransferase family 2 protein [archaeon]|nr:MAG: glycosyltransferase family 2 protein [archaeon]
MITALDAATLIGSLLTVYVSFVYLVQLISNRSRLLAVPKLPNILPKVSIIVPAHNEERTIDATLQSLLNLDYPKKLLQIIAVDDGSTDRTLQKMRKFSKHVTVLTKKNGGKASALNAGIKIARGDIVATTDADSYVESNALRNTLGYFRGKVAAVTTSIKIAEPKTFVQKVQAIEYLFNIIYRKVFSIMNSIFVVPGPFSLYKRSVLEIVGGFEENNITEDMEIALRLQSRGYGVENSVPAFTYTHAPATIRQLFMQRVRWYRGFIINMRRYHYMLFNPKYGDMGVFTLPVNIVLVAFLFIFIGAMSYSSAETLFRMLHVDFILGYVPMQFSFSNPVLYSSLFNVLWVLATGILIYLTYEGYKLGREKFTLLMIPTFFVATFVYIFFIGFTWLESIRKELTGAELKWEK